MKDCQSVAKAQIGRTPARRGGRIPSTILSLLAVASGLIYVVTGFLSPRFSGATAADERPILALLLLFAALFACYFAAMFVATRLPQTRRLTAGLWISSLVFRVVLLPSWPILEIDIYRYIWDGAAVVHGVSPYAFPPQTVVDAVEKTGDGTASTPLDLERLVQVQHRDPALAEVVRRIHFGDLSSPYPPVSQAVFAAAVWSMPAVDASARVPSDRMVARRLHRYVVHMKAAIVAFDLATFGIVCWLVRLAGCHIGWSLAYGWCPLVLKEFANSGHLDAIAIFFCTLAVALAVWTLRGAGLFQGSVRSSPNAMPSAWSTTENHSRFRTAAGSLATAAALSIAIGAKLYPVVLLPLLAITAIRRVGWAPAIGSGIAVLGLSLLVLSPMQAGREPAAIASPARDGDPDRIETIELRPPPDLQGVPSAEPSSGGPSVLPPHPPAAASSASTDGLLAFLRQWEMNDLIFMVVVENLRSQRDVELDKRPWLAPFAEWLSRHVVEPLNRHAITPLAIKAGVTAPLSHRDAAFLLARALTAAAWLAIACTTAWRASSPRNVDATDWLRAGFLAIAWFWLLAPTQNPWYWCWAVPLVCFARRRAWFALAALSMLYYLRFWLAYHWPEGSVAGTRYSGEYFFHFVIVWLEFGPWFVWLAAEAWFHRPPRPVSDGPAAAGDART